MRMGPLVGHFSDEPTSEAYLFKGVEPKQLDVDIEWHWALKKCLKSS